MSYVTLDQPAEPRRVTKPEDWTQWEGQVVNGIFPLRRFLGGSSGGAVFLSEYKAGNLADVAIKFVPAVASHAEAQLAQWRTAATLSHPHLIRLFDMGRCRLGEREFLFVVMEYAEQTLAQVLARRALGPDDVPEMLLPTLDGLAFLHRNQRVHARLKPSNILAVNDGLKLASDSVRPAGHAGSGLVTSSAYDPPELQERGVSAAGDIWSLGVTLAEALTQRTPVWSEGKSEISLPVTIPAPFANTVRRCLSVSPTIRPTVVELETQFKPAPPRADMPPDRQPQEPPRDVTASPTFQDRYRLLLVIPAALLLALAVWISLQSSRKSQADVQRPSVPAPAPVVPATTVKPAESNSKPSSSVVRVPEGPSSSPALVEVSPDVPRHIREKIQGRVFVTVRVLVDDSGNVAGVLMENAGPSKYFARLAEKAAREWKFAPANKRATRVWLVRFAFTRGGVTTRVTAV